MIRIEGLIKRYGKSEVLNIANLTIKKGDVIGLMGNNGAGKTTLLSLMLDLIIATNGSVYIDEINVAKSEEWKKIVGAYIDESFVVEYLTPHEYFNLIGSLRELNQRDVELFLQDFIDFFPEYSAKSKKYIRNLSKGNQKKVGIIGALIGNPDVVILDEPFANLDPSSQIKLRQIIKNISSQSEKTFIISSHNLDNVTDVCQRLIVLNEGIIVKDVAKTENSLTELEVFFSKTF